MASGPIDSAIEVKPRMSLKRMAIGRRSPPRGTTASCCGDLGGDVGGEVALEVRAHQRLALHLLGVAAVPDADGRQAAEGDQKLEVLVAEGIGRGQAVHVEHAQHLVAAAISGVHMALRTLCITIDCPLNRLSAAVLSETTATRSCTALSRDRSGHLLRPAVSPSRLRDIEGTSSPVASLRSTMDTRSTFITSNIMSTTLPSSLSRSNSPESFWEMSSSSESFLACRSSADVGRHPELAESGAAVPAGDAGRPAAAHHELANDGVTGAGLPAVADALRSGLGPGRQLLQLEQHLAEGDGVVGLEPPVVTRLPLMQVPLELPRSFTWTPSVPTVSSACRREMVGS